jgi:hydroxymethylpyrimidine/phosphomethylpyrimidine kinase
MRGRVLVVAGSDSGGGAGLQADIKTITALDAYAMTAVTAVTVQDTNGVHGVHDVPPDIVAAQIACVLDDIGADAVKIGMLGTPETVDAVASALAGRAAGVPLVLDPVMVAKGGAALMGAAALEMLRHRLLKLAHVITPNLPEAEALAGVAIAGEAAMHAAAQRLLALGVPAVLLKGGHLDGPEVVDLLATQDGITVFRSPRIATRSTHGTGCTLASALAAGLAQGLPLVAATARARAYVHAAILAAPGFGHGHGPLNHAITVDPARLAALG